MKPQIPLRNALADKKLLGDALAGDSWAAWRALLLAAMGEPLKADELEHHSLNHARSSPTRWRAEQPPLRCSRLRSAIPQ